MARIRQETLAATALLTFSVRAKAPEVDEPIRRWDMPHRGEASSSRCGTPGFKAHFDRETHWVRFNHDCKEYDCGICKSEARAEGGYIVRGWECREALSIVERLEAFQDQ